MIQSNFKYLFATSVKCSDTMESQIVITGNVSRKSFICRRQVCKTLLPCFIEIFNGSVDHDQTPRSIWVCAVCHYPFYGTPCLALWVNGLMFLINVSHHLLSFKVDKIQWNKLRYFRKQQYPHLELRLFSVSNLQTRRCVFHRKFWCFRQVKNEDHAVFNLPYDTPIATI